MSTEQPLLNVRNLVKTYVGARGERDRTVRAVAGISFTVQQGELLTLLGPSGCGKTTTLRCLAGLERPDAGEISVADRVLYSSSKGIRLRANERGLGMVFQSYAIWPHMNVFNNVAFPLEVRPRRSRPNRKQIRERVERALAVVRLDELASRQATDLSGGQQQRLALARALIMESPLLLLDEPLSNLDAKLREGMRFELKRLQRDLGITAVYVTHDQVEALAMSSMIAVMQDGQIAQLGRPREIYERPQSWFVADFVGTSNFIPGTVTGSEPGGVYAIETGEGRLRALSTASFAAGDSVVVSIRPEHIEIEEAEVDPAEPWAGVVETRAFLGDSVDHVVRCGGIELRARCNPSKSIAPGSSVRLALPQSMCSLIPADN